MNRFLGPFDASMMMMIEKFFAEWHHETTHPHTPCLLIERERERERVMNKHMSHTYMNKDGPPGGAT